MKKTINDGGPAFPQPNHLVETDHGKMEARQWMFDSGMSLRDWFAGQALAANKSTGELYETFSENAAHCYKIADAMIKARENESKP